MVTNEEIALNMTATLMLAKASKTFSYLFKMMNHNSKLQLSVFTNFQG